MKIPGHYFCPKCDDIAFGEHCQVCHTAAEFIPVPVQSQPPLDARVGVLPNFNVPDGWFDQLRAAIK